MKNIYSLIIALLMIVTLNISRVSADTETPTPTETPTVTVTPSPTPESLFATAEATENYSDCPVATLDPSRYVDPMYFMQCYQCMPTATKTMTSTITPVTATVTGTLPTMTITATDDGNTTRTATIVPTQDYSPYTDYWTEYADSYVITNQSSYGTLGDNPEDILGEPDGIYQYYVPQSNLGAVNYGVYFDALIPAGNAIHAVITGCRDKADEYYYSLDGSTWVKFGSSATTHETVEDAHYFYVHVDPCASSQVGIDAIYFELSQTVTATPYPTTEVTATNTPATGYCNNWDYLETGAQSQIVSVSNIQIYAPEEIILLRGDYIDLSWIGSERLSEPIGWPTIALSVIKVDLGDVYILGFRLPIEMIVLPFVMFAISLLMRL